MVSICIFAFSLNWSLWNPGKGHSQRVGERRGGWIRRERERLRRKGKDFERLLRATNQSSKSWFQIPSDSRGSSHSVCPCLCSTPPVSLSLRSSPTTTAAAVLKNLLHISQNLSWKLHFTNAQNSRTVPSICYVRTSSQKGSFVTHGNFSVNLTSSKIWRVRIRTHYCTLVGQRAYHGASPPHPV